MRGKRAAKQQPAPLGETGVECFGGRTPDVAIIRHEAAGLGEEWKQVGRAGGHEGRKMEVERGSGKPEGARTFNRRKQS
jgi:hypothetical protein